MNNYVFILATTSDVGQIDLAALIDLYNQGSSFVKTYPFQAPTQCDDATVSLIGKGFAFNAGYNSVGTISMVIAVNP